MRVVPAPGDTTLSRGCGYTAPCGVSEPRLDVFHKTCYSESFPSVKRGTYYVPHYRLKGAQPPSNYRLKGAHVHVIQIM